MSKITWDHFEKEDFIAQLRHNYDIILKNEFTRLLKSTFGFQSYVPSNTSSDKTWNPHTWRAHH